MTTMPLDSGERRPLLSLTARRRRKSQIARTRVRDAGIVAALVGAGALLHLIGSATHRDLVDELATAVETLSSCGACKSLLAPLKAIAHFGDATFLSTLITLCAGLGIQDPVVCRGALGAQAPILAHSLRGMSIGGPTGTLFCAKTFGLCEYPRVREWDLASRLPERLRDPASHQGAKPPRAHRPPLQVVHLSDLHIDREYSIGRDADCARNLCCRSDQPSDTPGTIRSPAGPYGNHNCDSPVSLYISMLRAIPSLAPNLSFALHTGDMVDHAVWKSIRKDVEDGVGQGHSQYGTHLSAPLYGVIGNHDVAPTNSFPRNTTLTSLSSQWDLELFSETWQPWIGHHGARSVREASGCYSVVHPGTRLKIISLNTNLWYKANFWLYDSDSFQPDPNGILAWLVGELQDAEDRGLRAWLMGHMSPGKSDCLREPSRYLNRIMRRYRHTIAASFFGHTHRSEFEIVYEDAEEPTADSAININFIGPALTPESGNPAFRIYSIDPETYEVLDFREMFTNMTDPLFQENPRWETLYTARSTYGDLLDPPIGADDPLDGTFWHRVTEVFERNYEEFEKFIWRLSRGGAVKPCISGACRKRWIEALRASESEFNGATSSAGLNIDAVEEDDRMQPGEEDGRVTCGDWQALLASHEESFRTDGVRGVNTSALRAELAQVLAPMTRRRWFGFVAGK